MLRRTLIIGSAVVAIVVLCGGLIGFNLFRSKAIADFFASQTMPAATVSAMEVRPVTWTPQIAAIGTLNALQGVDLAVEVGGVVQKIGFKANDMVAAGQLLIQLDDAVERADLAAGQAALERDRAGFERARTLSRRGVSSEANLESAETALAASQSALARTQATIELKSIKSPFAGTIGIPRVEPGGYVQPGTVVATLQQLQTMRVDFTVPEQEVGNLKLGQKASFGLREDDFPFEGRITGIDPKIDPQTRLVSVRAELENPAGALLPGQFVRVRVDLPPVPNVIALPQTSVVTSLYGDYVYIVDPAPAKEAKPGEPAPAAPAPAAGSPPQLVARQAFVQIGRRQGTEIEVLSGVEPGQTVVTSGQNKLANSMPLIINNSVDPTKVAEAAQAKAP